MGTTKSVIKRLRQRADIYYGLTKDMTRQINKIRAVERGDDDADEETITGYKLWKDRFTDWRAIVTEEMAELLEHHAVWPFLESVPGVGVAFAGTLLGMWGNFDRYPLLSGFIRHSGYGLGEYYVSDKTNQVVVPVKGWKFKVQVIGDKRQKVRVRVELPQPPGTHKEFRIDKPVGGWLLSYNKELKSRLHQTLTSMFLAAAKMPQNTHLYRMIYDEYKEKYSARPLRGPSQCPFGQTHYKERQVIKCSVGKHTDNAARRKALVIFLHHVWEYGRRVEGLPIRDAYVIEVLGHARRYPLDKCCSIPVPPAIQWTPEMGLPKEPEVEVVEGEFEEYYTDPDVPYYGDSE